MSKIVRSLMSSQSPQRLIAIAVFFAVAALGALAAVFVATGIARFLALIVFVALSAVAALAYYWFCDNQRHLARLAQEHATLLADKATLTATLDDLSSELAQLRAHSSLEQQRIDAVLRETGHRIGNSLATVSSLLALQSLRSPSDDVREALEVARHRVHAIASSHRRVRSGQDSDVILTDEFLPAVIDDLASNLTIGDQVGISSHVEPIAMTTRYATTLGILVSELVTNAMKHAFFGRSGGEIVVRLERLDGVPVLSVADDGIGMPSGTESSSGLGLVLVKQLAGQFGGAPEYKRPDTGGTRVVVPLPVLESVPARQQIL